MNNNNNGDDDDDDDDADDETARPTYTDFSRQLKGHFFRQA